MRKLLAKSNYFIAAILCIYALIFYTNTELVNALETNPTDSKINKLEKKIAKSYADKFCNAIGIGMSKESSAKLTILENQNPKYNPSLWIDLAKFGKKKVESLDEKQIIGFMSEKVINNCGYPLGLKGRASIDEFTEYFLTLKQEIENQ